MPLASYPFAYWRQKRNLRNAVVELAVRKSVPDAMEVLEQASIVGKGEREEVIWSR